jgi:hypothetical protein
MELPLDATALSSALATGMDFFLPPMPKHADPYLALQSSPLGDARLFSSTSTLMALLTNAHVLGIACHVRPVRRAIHLSASSPTPPSLKPTALQLRTPHLPFVALLPFPLMRDTLLRAEGIIDPVEFWVDLIDNVTVWGRTPWDKRGWEVNEAFARKWSWVVGEEVLEETNFWRVSQGLDPLAVSNGVGTGMGLGFGLKAIGNEECNGVGQLV